MTLGLAGGERTVLERFVQRTRGWVEDDLASSLEGRFGIRSDGVIEDVGSVSLTNAQLAVRAGLVDIVEFLRAEGEDAAGSVERLVREAAFTHTNRLIAVRVAEAIGVLPETMARGVSSSGFKDFSELAPIIADTDWGRFAVFVRLCADELASDVPALFDPRNPLLDLEVSEAVLAQVVEAMQELPDAIWAAPDALGWAYQFFNTGEERSEMRESSAPRNSRELAVRNQFFTPSYVVEFLIQNGLGAHLSAGFPELADQLPLLAEVPEERLDVDLNEVSVLDPACGSGHFLLGAYDVLEQAWQCAGVGPADSAPAIVRSLWGIDIDPRATQIAQAAVMFRARRHCQTARLPKPNVICARALPAGPEADALIAGLPEHVGRAVGGIADALVDAPILGPLLKIEERLDREVRDVFGTGVIEGTLADTDSGATQQVEAEVLVALTAIADSTSSTATQRLFAAEAHDAIRFIEAMTRRYTAVVMNPPFGEPVASTKTYLKTAYPLGWTEMYAAFIERGLGYATHSVGLVSSSEYFRTKRLRGLRKELANGAGCVSHIAKLGLGVLHGASVDASLTLIQLESADCQTRFASPSRQDRSLPGKWEWTSVDLQRFTELPGSPFPFSASAEVLSLFDRQFALDPDLATVRKGQGTFDNFRFRRLWWEVDSGRLTHFPERGWNPYMQGGTHVSYLRSTDLRIDMRSGGESMVEAAGEKYRPQVFQSSKFWGQSGLAVPDQGTEAKFSLVPAGHVMGGHSIMVFPHDRKLAGFLVLALNSSMTLEIMEAFAKVRSNEAGYVKNLPLAMLADSDGGRAIERVASMAVARAFMNECRRETSIWFVSPLVRSDREHEISPDDERVSNDAICRSFGLTPELHRRLDLADGSVAEADSLLSYLVGCAIGRWDLRLHDAVVAAPTIPEILEEGEPRRPRAVLEMKPPADYPLVPAPSGLLVDDRASELDVERVVREAGRLVFGEGANVETLLESVLDGLTLGSFLRRRFFSLHEKRYSGSQRRAPIYWQLQVPSKAWGVWIYAPRLSREMLFAIVRHTEERQRLAERQINHLQREAETGAGGRRASEVARELETEQELAVELETFRAEAERIANLGWEPDLDDGMVLNAAPLADLFPAWKEAAKYREELRAGKYEWATVAQYADQL